MRQSRLISLGLVAPALLILLLLFVYPLGFSLVTAFVGEQGNWTFANFAKAFEFYSRDILFSVVIVTLSTALIGTGAIAIGGYLVLGESPRAVAVLRWLYRWPLFIPFVVAGQLMRTFLAKNGMMNNTFTALGLYQPIDAVSFLDWRGIVGHLRAGRDIAPCCAGYFDKLQDGITIAGRLRVVDPFRQP
jgi:ABC-type sugar transport system permease subunit